MVVGQGSWAAPVRRKTGHTWHAPYLKVIHTRAHLVYRLRKRVVHQRDDSKAPHDDNHRRQDNGGRGVRRGEVENPPTEKLRALARGYVTTASSAREM